MDTSQLWNIYVCGCHTDQTDISALRVISHLHFMDMFWFECRGDEDVQRDGSQTRHRCLWRDFNISKCENIWFFQETWGYFPAVFVSTEAGSLGRNITVSSFFFALTLFKLKDLVSPKYLFIGAYRFWIYIYIKHTSVPAVSVAATASVLSEQESRLKLQYSMLRDRWSVQITCRVFF